MNKAKTTIDLNDPNFLGFPIRSLEYPLFKLDQLEISMLESVKQDLALTQNPSEDYICIMLESKFGLVSKQLRDKITTILSPYSTIVGYLRSEYKDLNHRMDQAKFLGIYYALYILKIKIRIEWINKLIHYNHANQ